MRRRIATDYTYNTSIEEAASSKKKNKKNITLSRCRFVFTRLCLYDELNTHANFLYNVFFFCNFDLVLVYVILLLFKHKWELLIRL